MSDTKPIGGHDPVACSDGKALLGTNEFTHEWNDATWRFVSAANRDAFAKNPERYAPQFGGACAFAGALGKTGTHAPAGEPSVAAVANDKLYLFSNRAARALWRLTFAPRGRLVRWIGVLTAVAILALGLGFAVGTAHFPAGTVPAGVLAPVMIDDEGVALNGYDAVAYHLDNAPARGDAAISFAWNGAIWWFINTSNRDAFAADPARYAPLFGGHCAFAASLGKVEPGDPEVWNVVEGRLYLNANVVASGLTRALPGTGARAYASWQAE
ncbi:MAG: hypothetical protein GKS06_13540 [Acidobacteria bacterium]|nr:hypothetical protein [Acidobacteriota bacterium]